ncbi:DUF4843 domain-containing protein [Chitinophaga sp. sic0106]|uniref:DUF4843 domain-containing protein n=1 Tax=Chitinophaga sp. sic0106 TaxID=2854785 RepID=UPI001C460BEA|nr:DUF4843 domain-containing protein [Chitinophaga sp. sic0106]MBV7533020.1 DUF4843 domain-containing protein [Chitinophaga sp. sic0106]
MKKLALYALALLGFTSCEKEPGLTYTEKDKVYFTYKYAYLNTFIEFNQVQFSFGMLPDEVMIDTAKIAVKVMGQQGKTDRYYKVGIDQDSSTAVAGVHFEPLQAQYPFKAGLFEDTLRIVMLRSHLNSSHITQENRRLRLTIESSDDFNKGTTKGAAIDLYLNNYLSEPRWWKRYEGSGLYYYHPEKWKILMKFHPKFTEVNSDMPMDLNLVSPYFNSLRAYLDQNPTYDRETNARILIDKLVP